MQKAIFTVAEAEKARLRTGEQVLVGATKYQDSTSLNAVAKATTSVRQYSDFTPLSIQYLQK